MKKTAFLAALALILIVGASFLASPEAEAGTCPVPSLEICMDKCWAEYDFCIEWDPQSQNCYDALQSCEQMCLDNCS